MATQKSSGAERLRRRRRTERNPSHLVGKAWIIALLGFLLTHCASGTQPSGQEAPAPATTAGSLSETTTTSSELEGTTSGAEPTLTTRVFQTPSRNIGCAFRGSFLRCDILSGLRPEPTGDCELDWVGLGIGPARPSEPICAGDTAYDQMAPVLDYGRTWRRAGFACESRRTGLRCTGDSGHGFELARAGWEAF
jgi:hypothetical protein